MENFSRENVWELDSNRYHRPLRPSRKGSSVLLRLDVVDSPLWFRGNCHKVEEPWRHRKKAERDKEFLIMYAKTVRSRILSINRKVCTANLISLSLSLSPIFILSIREKKLIIAEINILLYINRRQIRSSIVLFFNRRRSKKNLFLQKINEVVKR